MLERTELHAVPAALRRRLRRADDPRGEGGWMILEAVICAALLIAVVIGVGAAIDGASAGSARDKARSVAAMLAEQDQERMRGMRAANLANYSATRTVTVDGAAYTVASSGDWVSDATGGTESCTMESRNADYLRIRSTVTSNIVGRQTRPVVLQSLVAPPVGSQTAGQGTFGVQVNDRNGAPVPNASVTITGSHTYSDLTSSVGCAIFANVPSGTYGVNLTHSGYVDPSGDAESTGTVSAGVTNVTSIRFDRAAQIHVGFITTIEGVDVRVRGWDVSAANAGVPGAGVRTFSGGGSYVGSIDATGLFPFGDGYAVYSGSCPSANPTRYTPTYYDSNPGFVTVDAGGSYSVSVRQPRTRVRFVKPGSTGTVNVVGGEVTVTSRDAGCTDRFTLTTDEHGRVTKPTTSEYGFDPSLPFGRWAICGYDPAINKSRTVEINNTSAAGASTSTVVELGASARTGRCP